MKKKRVSSEVIVFLFFIILGICGFICIYYLYNKEEINDDYLMTSSTSEEETTETTLPLISEDEVKNIVNNIFIALSDGVVNNQNNTKSESCNKLGNIGYYEDMCVSSNTNCKNIWNYLAPLLMNCYYDNNYPLINGYDENNNYSEYILMNKDDFKLLNDYFEIDNKYSDYKDFDLIYSRIINNSNIDTTTKDNFKNNYSEYLNKSYKILFHTNDNIIPSKYDYLISDISYENNNYRVTIKATSKDNSISKNGIMNVDIINDHIKLGKLSFR